MVTVETQCPVERERRYWRCWQIRSLGTTQCHLHSSVSADFTLCPRLSFSPELQLDDTHVWLLPLWLSYSSRLSLSDQVHFMLPQGQTPSAWYASLRSFENHRGYTHGPLGCCHTSTPKKSRIKYVFWSCPPFDSQFLAQGGAEPWRI